MQGVEVARVVLQQERCRPQLSRLMTIVPGILHAFPDTERRSSSTDSSDSLLRPGAGKAWSEAFRSSRGADTTNTCIRRGRIHAAPSRCDCGNAHRDRKAMT